MIYKRCDGDVKNEMETARAIGLYMDVIGHRKWIGAELFAKGREWMISAASQSESLSPHLENR